MLVDPKLGKIIFYQIGKGVVVTSGSSYYPGKDFVVDPPIRLVKVL